MTAEPFVKADPHSPTTALLRIKAVPGSSRDQIAGILGDRLKIKVAAPPEKGKANDSICRLLAKALRVAPGNIEVITGHASAEKVVRITGISAAEVAALLTN